MADLDDFFAKKDRKKSKAVKKFATADELGKKMDDPKQKPEARPKKDRPVQEGDEPGRAGDEDEWKVYEEQVKDYTGLKIQVLQGGSGAQDAGREMIYDESAPDTGKIKGPWNKPVESEAGPQPAPVVEEKPRENKSSAYVPPSSRVRAAEVPQRHTQGRHAPDIHNDDYFPVLGASGGKRGGGWSTAGGGAPTLSGQASRPTSHAQALSLGNRFTTLQDDS